MLTLSTRSRVHRLLRHKRPVAVSWTVPPVRSSDRVKLQPVCQMLSERVHTVYTGQFLKGSKVRKMTEITVLVDVCVWEGVCILYV